MKRRKLILNLNIPRFWYLKVLIIVFLDNVLIFFKDNFDFIEFEVKNVQK